MPDKNSSARARRLWRGAAMFLPLLAGLLAAYVLAQSRPEPARKSRNRARPGDVWRAVAEVSGRIVVCWGSVLALLHVAADPDDPADQRLQCEN